MESLTEALHRINESLAIIRQCRPAWNGRYSMGRCWTEEETAAFECRHGCVLPTDYREFLKVTGTAGAGPDYGLYAPDENFPDSGAEECLHDDVDLSLPFPHHEAWAGPQGEEPIPDEEYFHPRHWCGSLLISDRGCALHNRLVITGPCAGEIWRDDMADGRGLSPALAPDGSRYTFLRWYLDWLDIVFYSYGHKGLMRQLRPEDAAKAVAVGAKYIWVG